MDTERVDLEGSWLAALAPDARIDFLASLGRNLTIAARSVHEVEGDGLCELRRLRAINEVQHRVLACLQQSIHGTVDIGFVRSISGWVHRPKDDNELEQVLAWVWSTSKERGA